MKLLTIWKKNISWYYSLIDPLPGMFDTKFYKLMAKYKFTLAMENSICDDYITEKLWRPLHLGSVPIVLGSPKVQVWQDNVFKSPHRSNWSTCMNCGKMKCFLVQMQSSAMSFAPIVASPGAVVKFKTFYIYTVCN